MLLTDLVYRVVDAADSGTWCLDKDHSGALNHTVSVELVNDIVHDKLQLGAVGNLIHGELELARVKGL